MNTIRLLINVDAINANIVEYTAMDEQGRLAWVRTFLEVA